LNDEFLENVGGAVVAYGKAFPKHLSRGIEENKKNQDIWSLD
jgi:hypothetical protein